MQKGLCENMASSRYPLCKHPAIVPCLRGLRPTSHCRISYFSNLSPLVLIGDCLISYFSSLSLLVLIGAFQIYALKFEGYKPRSLAAHRSIIACLWASVPLAQLCRLTARISDWSSIVVLFLSQQDNNLKASGIFMVASGLAIEQPAISPLRS
ncbi:hypothetical protein V6Z11_D09G200100 [Gossypium hirsutum]